MGLQAPRHQMALWHMRSTLDGRLVAFHLRSSICRKQAAARSGEVSHVGRAHEHTIGHQQSDKRGVVDGVGVVDKALHQGHGFGRKFFQGHAKSRKTSSVDGLALVEVTPSRVPELAALDVDGDPAIPVLPCIVVGQGDSDMHLVRTVPPVWQFMPLRQHDCGPGHPVLPSPEDQHYAAVIRIVDIQHLDRLGRPNRAIVFGGRWPTRRDPRYEPGQVVGYASHLVPPVPASGL